MKIAIAFLRLFINMLFAFNEQKTEVNLYTIYKIDSVASTYVIYAEKDERKYKILSAKTKRAACDKIRKYGEYVLRLRSIHSNSKDARTEIDCFGIEKDTFICYEKDMVRDLFFTLGACK